ncbi:MAG: outer membrane protein assembly factor BamD [Thermodesulfobacteriota bacterium]
MQSKLISLLFLLLSIAMLSGCAGKGKLMDGEEGRLIYEEGLSLYKKERYNDAIKMFEKVLEEYPLGPYAAKSALFIADSHYYNKAYRDAYTQYTDFIDLHPAHSRTPYALYQKGMSSYKRILPVDRDQSATKKALLDFNKLISLYPENAYSEKAEQLVKECRKRLADREAYIALFYMKSKNYRGALIRLKGIIKEYPEAGINDKVLFNIGKAYIGLGEDDKAKETFVEFISLYPDNEFIDEIKGLIELEPKEGR